LVVLSELDLYLDVDFVSDLCLGTVCELVWQCLHLMCLLLFGGLFLDF